MLRIRSILLAILLLPACWLSASADRYVWLDSPDATNGQFTSWLTAATNIADAISVATNNETIWVTNGTYCLTEPIVIDAAIVLQSVNGSDVTILDGACLNLSNSCVRIDHADAIVDGFTISNGFAETGGGALINNGLMRNCLIIDNNANASAGGVYLAGGMLADSVVAYNTAAGDGGGVYLAGGMLVHCALSHNRAGQAGGGIYCRASGEVENCAIAENLASAGGGVYIDDNGFVGSSAIASNSAAGGAGVYLADGMLVDCTIFHNTASADGGGIYCNASGEIDNCTIAENLASAGGGIYIDDGIIDSSAIVNNSAETGGGAWINNALMRNCQITDNSASVSAGGVYLADGMLAACLVARNAAAQIGGGVYCSASGQVENCAIAENLAASAGGVYLDDSGIVGSSTIASNSAAGAGGIYINSASSLVLNSIIVSNMNSDIHALDENTNVFYYCCCPTFVDFVPDQGNLIDEPKLTNPDLADYRLQASSPCINAGSNQAWMELAQDLEGNPRIIGGIVDMGAYEFVFLGVKPSALTNSVMSGDTASSSFTICNNAESDSLYWTITATNNWIKLSSYSGTLAPGATQEIFTTNGLAFLAAGVYQSTVTIATTNASGLMLSDAVAMTLNVMELIRDPMTLYATSIQNQNGSNQTFRIWNAAGGALPYSITPNVPWLTVEPASGILTGATAAATNIITVAFNTAALASGPHAGSIAIQPLLGGNARIIDVDLLVDPGPMLGVSAGALELEMMLGQSVAEGQLALWNNSAGDYAFDYEMTADQAWLTLILDESSGSNLTGRLAPGETNAVTLSVLGGDLQPGISNATLTITATNSYGNPAIGSPARVAVTLRIKVMDLSLSSERLLGSILQGYNAATQHFELWNGSATNSMNFRISDDVPWLMVVPTNGSTALGEHVKATVSYNTAALDAGTSNATISVVAWDPSGAWASTSAVAVSLTVKPRAVLACDSLEFLSLTKRQGQTSLLKSFRVWNDSLAPKGGMYWTASVNVPWLRLNPSIGRSKGDYNTITETYQTSGLKPGRYQAMITLHALDEADGRAALQSPIKIRRELVVQGTKGLDFFGDGSSAAVAVYGVKSGWWGFKRLSDKQTTTTWFGGEGYQPVPADYNGDGQWELALYCADKAAWYLRELDSDYIVELRPWGGIGYEPVVGDFDGDGRADYALYAESSGMWYILRSSDGQTLSGQFGGPGYRPLAGDFDGDGISDVALYHVVSGNWYIINVSGNVIAWDALWGGEGFTPVVGDFNGDGCMDMAAYHEATGLWFAQTVTGQNILWWVPWGGPDFKPVSGDYNGDAITELTVYHEPSGTWFMRTVAGTTYQWKLPWGGPGYIPLGE